ncbi:MAG: hypothetical protein JNL32_09960 [Candidatus Kapabacteria bacterium]|nr:hypothetical protein [Candidatus Kapabacteria bacterium]
MLLQKDHAELIGSSIPEFKQIYHQLAASIEPTVLSQLQYPLPDGTTICLEVSARFIEHEGQKLILAIARDTTRQRELSEHLIQADKMMLLGQLSASIAHEVRNPLSAMNLSLQMLQRKMEETDTRQHYINASLRGVERIQNIVDTTLNFAKPVPPQATPATINSVIIDSLDLVSDVLLRKTIAVDIDLDDNLPHSNIDVNQMQQVLINIITNAADAITVNGEIHIRTFAEDADYGKQWNCITVTDNGSGISSDDLQRIFEPFFTRKAEGTGLGLPIIQRIVHQHGGVITVASDVGYGTTFMVKIPAVG